MGRLVRVGRLWFPQPMNVTLLHNESAGDQGYSRADLVAMLRREGYRARPRPLDEALKRPSGLGYGDFVIVAGGDGSLRRAALTLAGLGRPIAPLPIGTANNIARSLGIEGEPRDIIRGWARGRRRGIDLGLASGPWGERRFIEGVGIGLLVRSISILTAIDRVSTYDFEHRMERLNRDLCVVTALAHEAGPVPVRIGPRGRGRRDEVLLLEVLNIRRAGPGIELSGRADPGDGWLDLVSADRSERPRLVRKLMNCLTGRPGASTLASRRCRAVELWVRGEVRIDDQVVPAPRWCKLSISLEKNALQFVVPS